MKKTTRILWICMAVTTTAVAKDLKQQQDIAKVVKELTYLIQVAEQLQHKHRGDKSKIQFNYTALIKQLKAAKQGSQEYLNHELYELHAAPPATVVNNLTKAKP